MRLTILQNARYWVLLLLVFLITFSSHPVIVTLSKSAGMENGTILSRYIILVFICLFILCLNVKSMLKAKVIRFSWVAWILIVLFYLLTYSLFGTRKMMSDVRSIAICLVAIMVGWQLYLDKKRFQTLLLVFSGLILFVGMMQVFMNVGGFAILDRYTVDNKNALGVMLATGFTIFLHLGLNRKERVGQKVFLFGLALLTFVVLLTIRARLGALTVMMLFVYLMYERFKSKNFVLYLLLGVLLATIILLILPSSATDYFYNSFFQNREEDITSGRIERNIAALHFLSQHPFLGNLNQNESIGWVHNYLLNKAFEYGVVFSIPLMLLYFFLLFIIIKRCRRVDSQNTMSMGFFLLLIPFIISMGEPTVPFGPGTATVFNFIVFGLSLRYSYNDSLLLKKQK